MIEEAVEDILTLVQKANMQENVPASEQKCSTADDPKNGNVSSSSASR